MCTECQGNVQSAKEKTHLIHVLANIEFKITKCRTIVSCALDYLPSSDEDRGIAFQIEEIGNLTSVLGDILDLCQEDVKQAYEQLEAGRQS